MKLLVVNGPNLNLLGQREEGIYGSLTLEEINHKIEAAFAEEAIELDFFQSNSEGELITIIQEAQKTYEGIVLNAGAYSHYSIAILDAIRAISIPVIEVHLSNIFQRETYRRNSVISEGCMGVISGLGYEGYIFAIQALYHQRRNRAHV